MDLSAKTSYFFSCSFSQCPRVFAKSKGDLNGSTKAFDNLIFIINNHDKDGWSDSDIVVLFMKLRTIECLFIREKSVSREFIIF